MNLLVAILLWVPLMAMSDGYLETAVQLYKQGDYRRAILAYEKALAEEPTKTDLIKFNIAQCWYALDTTAKAEELYREVWQRLPAKEKAIALSNLGVIQNSRGAKDRAMEYFKQALLADADNEQARYNYELLLKRRQQDPPPPPPPPPSRTPPPPPLKPSENGGNTVPMPANPAEARKQLEDLRAREKQYLQQQRKRTKARARYSDTPDW
jgi:tetratricopeptide (TPR) repeat protein